MVIKLNSNFLVHFSTCLESKLLTGIKMCGLKLSISK